jgi:anti-sigma factor RsiW
MNCKSSRQLLSAYADNELAGKELNSLTKHLSGCNTCRDELAQTRQLTAMLRRIDDAPVASEAFPDRVMATINRPRQNLKLGLIYCLSAAAVITLVSFGVVKQQANIQVQSDRSAVIRESVSIDRIAMEGADPTSGGGLVQFASYSR